MAGNTMATIEPRLMHLLNVNDSKDQLPSIHSTLGASNSPQDALLLPPLELIDPKTAAPLPTAKLLQQSSLAGPTDAAFTLASGDDPSAGGGGWPVRSLRMVLGESAGSSTDLTFVSAGTDDLLSASASSASIIGKRPRVLPHTDELIQLPQPLKKQKSSQQVGSLNQVFPPIINGLHEPPPNAAVFPPIASEFDVEDTRTRGPMVADFAIAMGTASSGGGSGATAGSYLYDAALLGPSATTPVENDRVGEILSATLQPITGGHVVPSSAASASIAISRRNSAAPVMLTPIDGGDGLPDTPKTSPSTKTKRRATKPRRRWTEEETNQLLIGVSRHGLGKWTAILEDPEFSFSSRSAGDLKDRFRTCCPDELRGKLSRPDQPPTPDAAEPAPNSRLKSKTSLSLDDILIEPDDESGSHTQGHDADATAPSSAEQPKLRKRRVHRRNMEDMVKLGIQGPFKKSHRRERRPFTEQDDREILEGLRIYGPAWTKIHRHPGFNLSSRQPTDLRDRVRNKYPETYASIEKGVLQSLTPEATRTGSTGGSGSIDSGTSRRTASSDSIMNLASANTLLEPSVNTAMGTSMTPGVSAGTLGSVLPHHPAPGSRQSRSLEDQPKRPTLPSLSTRIEPMEPQDPPVFDLNEPSSSTLLGNVGEMGISRLLLDDPQIPSYSIEH